MSDLQYLAFFFLIICRIINPINWYQLHCRELNFLFACDKYVEKSSQLPTKKRGKISLKILKRFCWIEDFDDYTTSTLLHPFEGSLLLPHLLSLRGLKAFSWSGYCFPLQEVKLVYAISTTGSYRPPELLYFPCSCVYWCLSVSLVQSD